MNSETLRQAQGKHCQNCKSSFVIEPEDFAFYEKIKVPPPTWCPECRFQRRMVSRNERNLFRVKDAHDGKEIFSGIPPTAPVKIYEREFWWSDGWDPVDYGRDYDFSRPFFEQFRELMHEVPFPSRNMIRLVNSDYSDHCGDLKNCYLCFNLGETEDSAYMVNAHTCKNSFDINMASQVELSYDSFEVGTSYKIFFSHHVDKSNDIWLSKDLSGCSYCFGCINLRNKQYHIFNRPFTKERYFEELNKMNLSSFEGLMAAKESAESFWINFPVKYYHGLQNVNVIGDHLHNSKNVQWCYDTDQGEDSKYCQEVYLGVKDSYDYSNWGDKCELIYDTCGSGIGCKGVKFSLDCWPEDVDVEYSMRCGSSSNLFGCIGLRNKSYCIFNKQYTPEEYVTLREKIIQHMKDMPYRDGRGRIYRYGEYFPPEFSLFAYNESSAQDYFPLSKEEALQQGYTWRDPEPREFQTTIDSKDLADRISDVEDSILKEIIKCSGCGKAYRIIALELAFLRENQIPLPRICWVCRHNRRLTLRNLPHFYERTFQCTGAPSENERYKNLGTHFHGADHCPNEFYTTFAQNRSEIVYCEPCYQQEIS
jgi:hypothetical protein